MQYAPKETPGQWSRDQMQCGVCGADDIFLIHPVYAVAHPGTRWVLAVISITALLLNLLLYVVYNKCSCHGASLIQMGTSVTNNVSDSPSRCRRAIIRTTDTVWLRLDTYEFILSEEGISNVTLTTPKRPSIVRLTQYMVELAGVAQRK